ncbi:MAG: hypothetical protein PVH61_04520 [Candidatus Aminicenantes bacterium]|jgi:hypothetical protein
MKKRLKCNLYKFLFRLLPIHAWQVFLMDKHLSVCSHCREDAAADDQVRELLVSPGKAKTLPGIWPYVHKHMENTGNSHTREPGQRRKWSLAILPGWQWKAAAVGLFLLLVIVFFPFSFEKKQPTSKIHQAGIDAEDRVVVKSVKIGSRAAKFYFFESKDPNKVIVWAERK